MSSSSSESENSQNDSEYNFIPGNVFEAEEGASEVVDAVDDICRADVPYADEPLADEAWLAEYNEELRENEEQEREFSRRLEGSEPLEAW